jgi:hypothetical protein
MIHRMQTLDNPAQLPICAVCDKPVERVERDGNHDGSLTYRVFCHGEVETTTLTIQQMAAADIYIGKAFMPCALSKQLEEKYGPLFATEATDLATRVQRHMDEELTRLIAQHGKEAVDAAIKESLQHPEPALGFVKRRLNLVGAVMFGRASDVTIHGRALAAHDFVLLTNQRHPSLDGVYKLNMLPTPPHSGIDVKICKGCKTEIYGKGQYCDRHKVPKPARGRAAKQFYKGRGG